MSSMGLPDLDRSDSRAAQLRMTYFYMFMAFAPGAVVYSFFPVYYKEVGYTDAMYGLQNALIPIVGMTANYLFGYISDKTSRMKGIILGLLLAMTALMFVLFRIQNPWTVMGFILLFQFVWIPISVLTESMAMLQAKRLGNTYAVIRGFGAAGFAVSAVAFGWVLDRFPGHQTLSWIMIVLALGTVACLLPIRDPRDRKIAGSADRGGTKPKVNMRELVLYVKDKRFIFFMLVLVMMNISFVMNDQYFSFLIRERGGTQFDIGLGWMLPAAIEVGVFMYLGRKGGRFRPLVMLAAAALIFGIRALVLAYAANLTLILVFQAVQGVAIAFYLVNLAEYMMLLIPDRFRSSGQAILNMVMSIGATVTGSLLGATLYNQFGIETIYGVSAALVLTAIIGFVIGQRLERQAEASRRAAAPVSADGAI